MSPSCGAHTPPFGQVCERSSTSLLRLAFSICPPDQLVMTEPLMLNEAETMMCVSVVLKQYLYHSVTTGRTEHPLIANVAAELPPTQSHARLHHLRDAIPSLREVCRFCWTVLEVTNIDAPCAIIALIHLERAMEGSERLPLMPASWRVLLLAAMLVTAKVLYDAPDRPAIEEFVACQVRLSCLNVALTSCLVWTCVAPWECTATPSTPRRTSRARPVPATGGADARASADGRVRAAGGDGVAIARDLARARHVPRGVARRPRRQIPAHLPRQRRR